MVFVDINLLRDRDEPLLITQDFAEGELSVASDVSLLKQPVHAELQISLSGEKICVNGVLKAKLEFTCSRCVKSFFRSIKKNVQVVYQPDPVVEGEGEEFSLIYTDLDVGFYHGQQLDVAALISEQVVLEVPMKPVCKEQCGGLCDQCGMDLNEGSCDCQRRSVDPRLVALEELKKRIEKQ
ncbi:MAG: DUF177 domain-containing protein [Acidobacteriota bacterium]|nr:DUF177 domain-containing protein [Acidobacteriota bacterium]